MKLSASRLFELLNKDFTTAEMFSMNTVEFIIANWKLRGIAIIEVIDTMEKREMKYSEFLEHCTACGGNWSGMLLTGIQELYPVIYDLVPDDMGLNSFAVISNVLGLLGVKE